VPLRHNEPSCRRIVAPVSTAVLIPKDWEEASCTAARLPAISNIPNGLNWTDCPASGTIVVVQQPKEHVSAILGDIMVTRLQYRGVLGVVADGRIRDVKSCRKICNNTGFLVWSKGISAVGPSLEAKPWAVDIPIHVGRVCVGPMDILCIDEEDEVAVVIPHELLQATFDLLQTLKPASDGVLDLVRAGSALPDAVLKHPNFYSNYAAETPV
jgi:regulator of RNase E activity RraA